MKGNYCHAIVIREVNFDLLAPCPGLRVDRIQEESDETMRRNLLLKILKSGYLLASGDQV